MCPRLLTVAVVLALAAPALGAGEVQEALELFRRSEQEYRQGHFAKAVRLLQQAYELHPEPTLLYNLARALEGEGDFAGAIEAYERYLRADLRATDRGAIERRVEMLKEQRAHREKLEKQHQVAAQARAEAEARLEAMSGQARPSHGAVAPWVVTGVGAAGMVGGGIFGAIALGRHRAAEGAPNQAAAYEAQRDAERSAGFANGAYIGGGVVAAIGVGWVIIDRLGRHSWAAASSVELQLGPSFFGVAGRLP